MATPEELAAIKNYADTQVFQLDLEMIRDASFEASNGNPKLRRYFEDELAIAVAQAFQDRVPKKLVETEIHAGKNGFGIGKD